MWEKIMLIAFAENPKYRKKRMAIAGVVTSMAVAVGAIAGNQSVTETICEGAEQWLGQQDGNPAKESEFFLPGDVSYRIAP